MAAVYSNDVNPAKQFMAINANVLGSTRKNLDVQKRSEKNGHSAGTDGKITRRNGYVVTHEYGHLLHNALAAKNNTSKYNFTENAQKEITKIAKSKYKAGRSTVSKYGTKNSREFFAESFASLHSGKPNAFGKAMGDWLKYNKL